MKAEFRRGRGTVVLAAGDFPRPGGAARRMFDAAARVVCCDSAADACRAAGREPDAVVGDLDSVRGSFANMVEEPSQEVNDLEKAVRYCERRGWSRPVVLGATGGRDDHSLGNVFRALDLGLVTVTDSGRFVPVSGSASFRVRRNTAVSVFAPHPGTRMTSRGLEWPLDGVKFRNLYCATLNRASATRVELFSSRPVYVFIEEARR